MLPKYATGCFYYLAVAFSTGAVILPVSYSWLPWTMPKRHMNENLRLLESLHCGFSLKMIRFPCSLGERAVLPVEPVVPSHITQITQESVLSWPQKTQSHDTKSRLAFDFASLLLTHKYKWLHLYQSYKVLIFHTITVLKRLGHCAKCK